MLAALQWHQRERHKHSFLAKESVIFTVKNAVCTLWGKSSFYPTKQKKEGNPKACKYQWRADGQLLLQLGIVLWAVYVFPQ